MRLGLRFISALDVNHIHYLDSVTLTANCANTLYMQLVLLDSDSESNLMRYIPPANATLQLRFEHIDSKYVINRLASQPFVNDDRSIWSVQILPTDRIASNGLTAELIIGDNKYPVKVLNELRIETLSGKGRYYA